MARKEIFEGLQTADYSQTSPLDGNTTTVCMSGCGTEAQNVDQDGYDSDGLEAVTNRYGASGSSIKGSTAYTY